MLILSIVWLFWKGDPFWGSVLIAWSVPVLVLDNIIKPVLIKKGADLPLLLIFAGVIGGLLAFGVIGLFIGPVVLAVSHVLLKAWVSEEDSEQESANLKEGTGHERDHGTSFFYYEGGQVIKSLEYISKGQ